MTVLLCLEKNSMNDYVDLLSQEYQNKGINVIYGVDNFLYSNYIPDFIHLHWPEVIYEWKYQLPYNNDTFKLIQKRLEFYSSNNTKILYTVHNLIPHNSKSSFDTEIYNLIIKSADILIHHGKTSIKLLNNMIDIKKKKNIVVPHGPYKNNKNNANNVRLKYNIPMNKYIILNFGSQRKNKGTDFIKKVFNVLNDNNVFLFNIGPLSNTRNDTKIERFKLLLEKIKVKLLNKFSNLTDIKTIYKFVDKKDISNIVDGSDILFLGHSSGLNSGVIALAISHNKPFIAPDIGNFKEQANGWEMCEFYSVNDIESAKNAFKMLFTKISDKKPNNVIYDNTIWLSRNGWSNYVDIILREFD